MFDLKVSQVATKSAVVGKPNVENLVPMPLAQAIAADVSGRYLAHYGELLALAEGEIRRRQSAPGTDHAADLDYLRECIVLAKEIIQQCWDIKHQKNSFTFDMAQVLDYDF